MINTNIINFTASSNSKEAFLETVHNLGCTCGNGLTARTDWAKKIAWSAQNVQGMTAKDLHGAYVAFQTGIAASKGLPFTADTNAESFKNQANKLSPFFKLGATQNLDGCELLDHAMTIIANVGNAGNRKQASDYDALHAVAVAQNKTLAMLGDDVIYAIVSKGEEVDAVEKTDLERLTKIVAALLPISKRMDSDKLSRAQAWLASLSADLTPAV